MIELRFPPIDVELKPHFLVRNQLVILDKDLVFCRLLRDRLLFLVTNIDHYFSLAWNCLSQDDLEFERLSRRYFVSTFKLFFELQLFSEDDHGSEVNFGYAIKGEYIPEQFKVD